MTRKKTRTTTPRKETGAKPSPKKETKPDPKQPEGTKPDPPGDTDAKQDADVEDTDANPLISDEELQKSDEDTPAEEDDGDGDPTEDQNQDETPQEPEAPPAETKAPEPPKNPPAPEPPTEPPPRMSAAQRPTCKPCWNNAELRIPMVAYSTKPAFTYYRCPRCGETRRIARQPSAKQRKRLEDRAKYPPIDTR